MAQPPTFQEVVALHNAGHMAEAEAAGLRLLAAQPGDAAVHNLLGVTLARQGKAGAADMFLKAGALNPKWDEPYANLGLLKTQQQDFPAAVEALREALKRKPGTAGTAINLGNALKDTGAPDEAVAAYRQALGPGPHQAAAHNNIGAVLFERDLAEAVANFQRAVEIDPGFAAAQLNLGRGLFRLGRLEEAAAALTRAVALDPKSAGAAVMLANTLRDLGRIEEAIHHYRRTLDLHPGHREAAYNLGLALNHMGHHAEGLKAIARGPGIVSLSLAPRAAYPRRIAIPGGPHFIGAWMLDEPATCDRLIDLFESRSADHFAGRSAKGIDTEIKNSTDFSIQPADINDPAFFAMKDYLRELEACAADYAVQWPHFASMFRHVDIMPFNIQCYRPGGHFQRVHSERMSFPYIHRVMAWMTYLNDVDGAGDGGGETVFDHYGLAVKPERGKTLIWPAEWTHAHHGAVVKAGRKYVITGWMHFPPPR